MRHSLPPAALALTLSTAACDPQNDGFDGQSVECSGGKCDDATVHDAEPVGIWAVLALPPGADETLAATALTERVLGKRSWSVGKFSPETIGVSVGPGESLWFFEPSANEVERLAHAGWGARLWRMTEQLRDDPWVVDDDRTRPVFADEPSPPADADAGWLTIDDPDWFHESEVGIGTFDAWERLAAAGKQPGEGVIVAHADTGLLDCPELGFATTNAIDEGINTQQTSTRPGARDHFPSAFDQIDNYGHGTRTATLIVSPAGPESETIGHGWATGVAPAAELLPIRFHDSVLVSPLSVDNLARAIDEAVVRDADVISMSIGGKGNARLRASVESAARAGVIMVVAAGNGTGAVTGVTEPAEYPETIAVTASNAFGTTWSGANFGPEVDIAAPGEDVRHGRPAPIARGEDGIIFDTQAGVGTSLSTAIMAGVAALWVSQHGSDELRQRYCVTADDGAPDCGAIPAAFVEVLRSDGHVRPAGWDDERFGVGIVDALGVVEAELPQMCEDEQARFGWTACTE